MAWSFSNATKVARADAITAQIGTGGKLEIWTAAYGTLLATWTWTGNMFSAATGAGVLAMNAASVNPVTPAANGTAAIAKIVTSLDVAVVSDLLVTDTLGAGDVKVTNTAFVTTEPVLLNSIAVTEAA